MTKTHKVLIELTVDGSGNFTTDSQALSNFILRRVTKDLRSDWHISNFAVVPMSLEPALDILDAEKIADETVEALVPTVITHLRTTANFDEGCSKALWEVAIHILHNVARHIKEGSNG